MTRLVERISIEIELGEPTGLHGEPRYELRRLWRAIGHLKDAKGKWHLSSDGVDAWITNLGLEEVPEEGGGDN